MSDLPPTRPEERLDEPGIGIPGTPSVGPPGSTREPEPASLGRRWLAGLIDLGIGWLLVGIAVYAAVPEIESETLTSSQEQSAGIATLIALSVWINYMVFAEWRFGRTIGKAALGIRVVRLDGSHLTWNAALETGGVLVSDKIKLNFDISAIQNA